MRIFVLYVTVALAIAQSSTEARADICGSVAPGASLDGYQGPYGGYNADGNCHLRNISEEQCGSLGGSYTKDRGAGYTHCRFAPPNGQVERRPAGLDRPRLRDQLQTNAPNQPIMKTGETLQQWQERRLNEAIARMKTMAMNSDWAGAKEAASEGSIIAEKLGLAARSKELSRESSKYFYTKSSFEGIRTVEAAARVVNWNDFSSNYLPSSYDDFDEEFDSLERAVSKLRELSDGPEALEAEREFLRLKIEKDQNVKRWATTKLRQHCDKMGGVLVKDITDHPETDPQMKCTVKPISADEVSQHRRELEKDLEPR